MFVGRLTDVDRSAGSGHARGARYTVAGTSLYGPPSVCRHGGPQTDVPFISHALITISATIRRDQPADLSPSSVLIGLVTPELRRSRQICLYKFTAAHFSLYAV